MEGKWPRFVNKSTFKTVQSESAADVTIDNNVLHARSIVTCRLRPWVRVPTFSPNCPIDDWAHPPTDTRGKLITTKSTVDIMMAETSFTPPLGFQTKLHGSTRQRSTGPARELCKEHYRKRRCVGGGSHLCAAAWLHNRALGGRVEVLAVGWRRRRRRADAVLEHDRGEGTC